MGEVIEKGSQDERRCEIISERIKEWTGGTENCQAAQRPLVAGGHRCIVAPHSCSEHVL